LKQQDTSNFSQAFWLFISHCSSFAFIIVSAAILARYIDKSEYGTYKQIMYVYATLQTIFVAGLSGIFSYFLPRLSIGQGKSLVNKFTLVLGLLGASFSLVLYFGSPIIAKILNNDELISGLKIFALVPLFTLPTLGVECIYTALRKTSDIAFYQIVCKLLNLICVVVPVLVLQGSYKTAITGWTISAFFILLFTVWMKNRPYLKIKSELIPNMYKMVFSYSTPLMLANIVGLFLHSANQFFISRYYGTAVFAEFSNGYIPVPFIGMIAGSVKNVLGPLFSKAHFEGNMKDIMQIYKNAVLKVAEIVFPILVFCIFFAKDIMISLYGSQYAVSKIYFQVSILKDFCEVVPYVFILLAFGKSIIYFYIHIIAAIFIWTIHAIISYYHLHPVYIAIASSSSLILMSGFVYWYCNQVLHLKLIQPIIQHLLKVIIHASIILGAIYLFSDIFLSEQNSIMRIVLCLSMFYPILIETGKMVNINYIASLSNIINFFQKLKWKI